MNRFFIQTRKFSAGVSVDERIAKAALKTLAPTAQVLEKRLGLSEDDFEQYGKFKAKLLPSAMSKGKAEGKLVLVTALTPTKAGEGKTCTTVGLTDGLNKIGQNAMAALREPSLGPVFGMKGGAAGGGYAQVVPMDDINLHFTGDLHAIGTANNLLSALVDNHINWRNKPEIDSRRVEWKRVIDMNDRALRDITVGLGGTANGYPRQDGFDITVASEVMAIFCLSQTLDDLKHRLGNIIVGYDSSGKEPITARDIAADGAMTALLKVAFNPNIVQTLEGNLAMVHGGPFANIAHGCSSLIATQSSLKLADFVVTEAGFGADLGAEKFFDIKCRKAGLTPSCAVIVATIRALKLHGGVNQKELGEKNVEAVTAGMPNLLRHIENVNKFGVPSVVAINKFVTDSEEEIKAIKEICKSNGVTAVVAEQWEHGGSGAVELAEEVVMLSNQESKFTPLYPDSASLEDKVKTIASDIYRASDVNFESAAKLKLKKFSKMGYSHLPVCIAKTQYSFSDNARLVNAPENHTLHVHDVRLSAGAEFVVVLTGSIMTMPGLPRRPASTDITLDSSGEIVGLF